MERVLSALNYKGILKGVCNTNAIDPLISDYFVNAPIDDDDSDEEFSHYNSGWYS